MEPQNRVVLFGLIAIALILGMTALDPGMSSRVTFAKGLKPTSTQPQVPVASAGTAFTYQGQLKKNGALTNGNCYLQFNLYSDAGGTGLVAGPVNGNPNPVNVTNGLFMVQIDFGSGVFQGDARWLQTAVKCGSDTSYTSLGLQPLTPTPYALYSTKTAWGQHMAGKGVGLTATSSDWIGLAGVGTTSQVLNPFTIGVFGVYGAGDDVGVWGQPNISTGVGVEGYNPNSSNYGQLGTMSNGVKGVGSSSNANGVLGTSTTGDGVRGEASVSYKSGVYGYNGSGGYGVFGRCAGSGCYGMYSDGDMKVTGNLTVDGQASGFFPRPAYDSGWVWVNSGCVTRTHNLGGNAQNYLVDMATNDSRGINNYFLGGVYDNWNTIQGYVGFWYKNLTSASVDICGGIWTQNVRLRIWVYN